MMIRSLQQRRMLFAIQLDDRYREVCEQSIRAGLRFGTKLIVSMGTSKIYPVRTCTPEMKRQIDDSIKAAPTVGLT